MSVFYATGNRLDDGSVSYLDAQLRFVSRFAEAHRWPSEAEAKEALDKLARTQNVVTGLYVFEGGGEDGSVLSARERFRRDGKEAVFERLLPSLKQAKG